MSRLALSLAALAFSLLLVPAPSAASADDQTAVSPQSAAHRKLAARRKQPSRHWRGYGFLPGYRPPEVIERQRAAEYWASGPHFYGPAWPRHYHSRWNGGGFGPCWTQTPIGYVWTCGR